MAVDERKRNSRGARRFIGFAVLGVAALAAGALAFVLLSAEDDPEPVSGPTPGPTGTAPALPRNLGRGSDGDLRFVVTSLQCGLENIITADTRLAAEGQFCLLDLDVENVGAAPLDWPLECQFLALASTERLAPREEATLLDPGSQAAFGAPLEPGTPYREVGLIFDVPRDASVEAVELHASCGSEGLRLEA